MDKISFRGINITKVINKNIDIYRVGAEDARYLNKLANDIDVQRLMPNLDVEGVLFTSKILTNGLKEAQLDANESFLIAHDNTPCGILSSELKRDSQYVSYVCTWPTACNKKRVPFAGQILFQQLFLNFLKTDKTEIELDALKYGKNIDFYKQLGFVTKSSDAFFETMLISREKVKQTLKRMSEILFLKSINDNKHIDLGNKLKKIDFKT